MDPQDLNFKRRNWKTFFSLGHGPDMGVPHGQGTAPPQVRSDEGPQHNSVLLGGSELRKWPGAMQICNPGHQRSCNSYIL